eukprot:1921070-Alexandrium_andersonii.AAC.1
MWAGVSESREGQSAWPEGGPPGRTPPLRHFGELARVRQTRPATCRSRAAMRRASRALLLARGGRTP